MRNRCSDVAIFGTGAFALVCTAAQVVRTDLDWLRAPLSFYLVGPHADWVRAAYFALAVALVAVGVGFYRALSPDTRSAAPLLMFVIGAIALVTTAIAETSTVSLQTLEGFIHGTAASTAFLCTTTAMLLQSVRMRGDAAWRPRFVPAFALALFCFLAVWMLALRFNLPMPRGLSQKLLIVAILAWIAMGACWLRSSGRQQLRPASDA